MSITTPLNLMLHDDPDREVSLERLGLSGLDMLQLARVVVVVEGAHDDAVLRVVGSEVLAAHHALLLRMYGARNVPATIDSQLLMSATDAVVMLVVDNDAERQMRGLWTKVIDLSQEGDFDSARSIINRIRKLGSREAEWLAELAERALSLGHTARLRLFGLTRRDILEYLPPEAFGLREPWTALSQEWARTGRHGQTFKDWLREAKGASISVQHVERAARGLTELPHDLEELCAAIREASLVSGFKQPAVDRP